MEFFEMVQRSAGRVKHKKTTSKGGFQCYRTICYASALVVATPIRIASLR